VDFFDKVLSTREFCTFLGGRKQVGGWLVGRFFPVVFFILSLTKLEFLSSSIIGILRRNWWLVPSWSNKNCASMAAGCSGGTLVDHFFFANEAPTRNDQETSGTH
jgi:hypothetical protein